jgi:anti-sigma factor RsiW
MRDRVQAYADDELGLEGVLEVEAHLERCQSCREAFQQQRSFRRTVATLYPRRELPLEVERGVRATLRGRRWAALARVSAVAVAVVALGLAAMRSGRGEEDMPPEVRAALSLHRAAENGALSLGLTSRNVDDVNRWLRREVPFVTDVPAAATRGFALRGAAAVELSGTRAGYVLYQADKRPISLFVLPRRDWPPLGRAVHSGNVEFRWIAAGAERVVAWSHDPVSYLLISDAARDPSEACGVCHTTAGVGGARDLPAGAPHGGRQS